MVLLEDQLLTLHQTLESVKWTAFADNKFSVAKLIVPVSDRIENIVGKGENSDYQHLLLFPRLFQSCLSGGLYGKGLATAQGSKMSHSLLKWQVYDRKVLIK